MANHVDVDAMYDDYLDEVTGEIYIGGIAFYASRILKELDPIAYNCGMNDYIDMLEQDGDIFEWSDGEYYDEEEDDEEEEDAEEDDED